MKTVKVRRRVRLIVKPQPQLQSQDWDSQFESYLEERMGRYGY